MVSEEVEARLGYSAGVVQSALSLVEVVARSQRAQVAQLPAEVVQTVVRGVVGGPSWRKVFATLEVVLEASSLSEVVALALKSIDQTLIVCPSVSV